MTPMIVRVIYFLDFFVAFFFVAFFLGADFFVAFFFLGPVGFATKGAGASRSTGVFFLELFCAGMSAFDWMVSQPSKRFCTVAMFVRDGGKQTGFCFGPPWAI